MSDERAHETDRFRAQLEAAKHASTAQLLFRAARRMNEVGLGRLQAMSGQPVRAAHTALFPHITLEGVRQTALAETLGVSKQAVGQLVGELEAMGVVERVRDPSDGRARLVRFSAAGRQGLLAGLGMLRALEDEARAAVGDDAWRGLRSGLLATLAWLDGPGGPESVERAGGPGGPESAGSPGGPDGPESAERADSPKRTGSPGHSGDSVGPSQPR